MTTRRIPAKRAQDCDGCHKERIERGFTILWLPRTRRALCTKCADRYEARAAEVSEAARQAWAAGKRSPSDD